MLIQWQESKMYTHNRRQTIGFCPAAFAHIWYELSVDLLSSQDAFLHMRLVVNEHPASTKKRAVHPPEAEAGQRGRPQLNVSHCNIW